MVNEIEIIILKLIHNSYYFLQGNICSGLNNLDEALKLHTIGFDIRKAILGDHMQTAASCYKTGDLMNKIGNTESAM